VCNAVAHRIPRTQVKAETSAGEGVSLYTHA
jgi:hypothetical protein